MSRLWLTQLFDLNARIQQLTWLLIFYEKYSTSLSTIVLVVLTTANFEGGSVISAGTIHDLRRVKVPGTSPLWNPWMYIYIDIIFLPTSWILGYKYLLFSVCCLAIYNFRFKISVDEKKTHLVKTGCRYFFLMTSGRSDENILKTSKHS